MIPDHAINDMRLTVSIEVPAQEPMASSVGGRRMVPTEVSVTYWRSSGIRAVPKVVVSGYPENENAPRRRLYAHLPGPQRWPAWVAPLVDQYRPSWHQS